MEGEPEAKKRGGGRGDKMNETMAKSSSHKKGSVQRVKKGEGKNKGKWHFQTNRSSNCDSAKCTPHPEWGEPRKHWGRRAEGSTLLFGKEERENKFKNKEVKKEISEIAPEKGVKGRQNGTRFRIPRGPFRRGKGVRGAEKKPKW